MLVITSFNPSPFTSYTYICAPPLPKLAGCFVHSPLLVCSHPAFASTMSALPSPFTSPKPMPWVNRCQPALGVTACHVHGLAASFQSGSAYPNVPPELDTISGLPSPVMSPHCGDSLSTTSKTLCRFQCPVPFTSEAPFGFSNHEASCPGKP